MIPDGLGAIVVYFAAAVMASPAATSLERAGPAQCAAAEPGVTWNNLSQADFVKTRLDVDEYQYPMIGNAGLVLLADPYGFTQYRPSKASYQPNLYYSAWWEGKTKRATPFAVRGGYAVAKDALIPGAIASFRQQLDVTRGILTSDLGLTVDGRRIRSVRREFITAEGVLVVEISDDVPGVFKLQIAPQQHCRIRSQARPNGLSVSTESLGAGQGAALSVVASGLSVSVDPKEASVSVGVESGKPACFFLAAGSAIEDKAAYGDRSFVKASKASRLGFAALQAANVAQFAEFWGRSSLFVPDSRILVNYIRSQYLLKSMWDKNPFLTGCFGPRPEGYDGCIGTECDLMYVWAALLGANQADIARWLPDWAERTLDAAKRHARSFFPQTGGAKWPWLAGYDGTETGNFGGRESDYYAYIGTELAAIDLYQAEYTNDAGRLARAKNLLELAVRFQLDACEKQGGLLVGNWSKQQYAAVKKGTAIDQLTLLWALRACRRLNVGPQSWRAMADHVYLPVKFDETQKKDVIAKYQDDSGKFPCGDYYGMSWSQICTRAYDPFSPLARPTYNSLFGSKVGIGWLGYTFFKGCAASLAAQMGDGQEAFSLLTWNLTHDLIDGWYFSEYVGDAAKTVEIGAHAMVALAVQDMLFDGRPEGVIRVFSALPREWEEAGVGFAGMLANGGLVLSGSFSNEGSTVTLKNSGAGDALRVVLLRIPAHWTKVCEASGVRIEEVPSGQFAKMTLRVPAGQQRTLRLVAVERGAWKSAEGTSPDVSWSSQGWTLTKDKAGNGQNDGRARHVSSRAGAYARFTFAGTAIRVIGSRMRDMGYMRVTIDGVDQGIFNQFAMYPEFRKVIFEKYGLPEGAHAIQVECAGVTGYPHETGVGTATDVDSFQYLQAEKRQARP